MAMVAAAFPDLLATDLLEDFPPERDEGFFCMVENFFGRSGSAPLLVLIEPDESMT
jgi:hypothetical protein